MKKIALISLLFLTGCIGSSYTETYGTVVETGQCTRHQCAYTVESEGNFFHLTSHRPFSIGSRIPMKYKENEKGERQYFTDREYNSYG